MASTPAPYDIRVARSAHAEQALASAPFRADTETRRDPHPDASLHWADGQNPGWTAAERQERYDAVREYRGAPYVTINKYLRGQVSVDYMLHPINREPDERVSPDRVPALLDDILQRSPLSSDVVVYRGSRSGAGVFGDRLSEDLTGFEWREDAYSSTSANPDVAEEFGAHGLIMRILVPRGTGAVQLSGYTDRQGQHDEAELLLQRGLRHRVVADRGVREDGTRVIDVEVY